MPVTAVLSRKFYERLGDDATNELVGWLNAFDASYRNELREINEHNFQRFGALLDQRIAELRAELRIEIRTAKAETERRLLFWMFGFWVSNLGITFGFLKLASVF